MTAVGRVLPVIFSKPCKHERQVSGFSTFDRFGEEFVFSLISTINRFFVVLLNFNFSTLNSEYPIKRPPALQPWYESKPAQSVCRGVAIFAKAFLGIPAQQAAKITRPLMPSAAPAVLLHSLHTQQGVVPTNQCRW